MANTSVTYAGTGSQVNFTVPFPFISRDHVKVYVNTAEVLQPSIWYWVSDSQITFHNAPNNAAAIKIQRVTPGDTRLVDFQNGAVLTEADLDLSANQNFYLAQEAYENYAQLVNTEMVRVGTSQGIVDTDTAIIVAGLVEKLLADASAATLQAAVGDIELNGEIILDIQTKLDGSIEVINLIGAFNGDESAFLLDTTKVKLGTLDTDPTFASKITTLEAADTLNSASITTINTVTIPGVQDDVTDLNARYGVVLNANDYVQGFVINNGGPGDESNAFVVLADKFAIVDPSGDVGETEFIPFLVSGGVVTMQNVRITGDLIVDGDIGATQLNGTKLSDLYTDMGAITAGSLTVNATGFIKGGAGGYMSGNGFWLGYNSSYYRMHIGNPTGGQYLSWDGELLTVKGDILVGEYIASDVLMMSADTVRTANTSTSWVEKKAFTSDRSGTVRLKFDTRFQSGVPAISSYPAWRVKVDGVVVVGPTDITNGTYSTQNNDIAVDADEVISIELKDGLDDIGWMGAQIRNARVYGDVVITGNGGTVDVN